MKKPTFNAYEFMKAIAQRGLENQERKTEDYEDVDGILICGKCGEPRRKIETFSNPSEDEPFRTSDLLVTTSCKCDREKKERELIEVQAAEDMRKIGDLRKASLMDEKFKDMDFSKFKKTKHNERNLILCERYASKFDLMVQKNQGLLLWGDVGTGKSFAAACIANYLLNQKVPVVMTSFVRLLEIIQSNNEEETLILSRLNYAKLVIFDDLGAERSTEYGLEKVYGIIDSRYRKKLPMIVTSNLTHDEMLAENDSRYKRIYDRIFETCYPMQFTGPSWRKKEAAKRYDEMEKLLEG